MNTQFITDGNGKKKAVILSMKEYKKMIEELEDLEDIRLYDEVKSRKEKSISFDEYLKARKKKRHG
jgi:PHD/YefM family antitoxin component YafN of YafNO toxin-antitoxin module